MYFLLTRRIYSVLLGLDGADCADISIPIISNDLFFVLFKTTILISSNQKILPQYSYHLIKITSVWSLLDMNGYTCAAEAWLAAF